MNSDERSTLAATSVRRAPPQCGMKWPAYAPVWPFGPANLLTASTLFQNGMKQFIRIWNQSCGTQLTYFRERELPAG
jgi:hypothetical protein